MTDTTVVATHALSELDCEQTVRKLWDYLDGQLGPVDLAAVDRHLAACDRCPPHFEFERRFLQVVREARHVVDRPDESGTTALRARILAVLRSNGVTLSPELQS